MILVIAANFQAYLHFIEQWGLSRKATKFISSVDQLKGLENLIVLLAPGWWSRGDSEFNKSASKADINTPNYLRTYFSRLKFVEVL